MRRTAACKPGATFPPLLSPLTTLVGVTTLRAAGESGRRRRSLGASRSDARAAAAAALTLPRARVPGGWRHRFEPKVEDVVRADQSL
ncbi:Piwi-Like Protein 2 [Manis pentadactyla]|nr:Piwi-Like Protein 2 [Manis pentadactyla]